MRTAIHLGFSNIPRSLTRTIQPSKHGHRLQKALLLTVPGHLEKVGHAPQPDPSGGSRATAPSGSVALIASKAAAVMVMRIMPTDAASFPTSGLSMTAYDCAALLGGNGDDT
jgi:hypothetical protein